MTTKQLLNFCGMGNTYIRNKIRLCMEQKPKPKSINDLIQDLGYLFTKKNKRFNALDDNKQERIMAYVRGYIEALPRREK